MLASMVTIIYNTTMDYIEYKELELLNDYYDSQTTVDSQDVEEKLSYEDQKKEAQTILDW